MNSVSAPAVVARSGGEMLKVFPAGPPVGSPHDSVGLGFTGSTISSSMSMGPVSLVVGCSCALDDLMVLTASPAFAVSAAEVSHVTASSSPG